MTPAQEALERLRAGNARFVAGARLDTTLEHFRAIDPEVQRPFAAILSCSDSRVPPEIVFDHSFGDLFVIRVAGNVAGATQLASIEFAVAAFDTRLVVAMGHAHCGAVKAARTLDGAADDAADSMAARHIVAPVRRNIEAVPNNASLDEAIRANALASVETIRTTPTLAPYLSDGLNIVGAVFSFEDGRVEFLQDGSA